MTAPFTIGVAAHCTDGLCGRLTQLVVDPIDDSLTHLIVEPEHRQGVGRLVPVDRAEPHDDRVELICTREEFDQLPLAETVRFLPGTEGYAGSEPDETLLWPNFGGNSTPPVVVDTLPAGEVAVQRGEDVHALDGRIGEVEGLVMDERSRRVSHFVLKEGHLFARKDVTIPISAVRSVDGDGIKLSITKREVEEMPAVEFRRPGQ